MKKEIREEIELPEGYTAETDGRMIKIACNGKEISKRADYPITIEGNKIIIYCKKASKNEKKIMKSLSSHIKNAINGLNKKFVYKLQICSVHFPMNVSLKGKKVIIKNFLGEVMEREAEILENTEARIEKDIIIIESHDKEKAGQTAANIEKATRITKRDKRVFQDGIYITEKAKGRKK